MTNKQAREDILEMCRQDILFLVNAFCWTLDPRKLSSNSSTVGACLPFITWPYQDEALLKLDQWLSEETDGLIEKSRDMGASWCVCIWMLWRWMFHNHNSFLMVSRKEVLVDGDDDSLFSHIDFCLKRMPLWLLPAKTYDRSKLYLKNLTNESVIEGESTTENIGRGGRRTAILLDEFPAFEGGGFEVLSATADTTRCRLFNGTPKGTGNAFYAQREKGTPRLRMHWSLHPEKRRGLYRPIGQGQFEKLDPNYDYSTTKFVDEVPRGEEGVRSAWYDKECARRPHAWEIAQELDIDYQGSAFPFFDPRLLDTLREEFCRMPLWTGRIEREGEEGQHKYPFKEDARGLLKLWCLLDSNGRPPGRREYVAGCDISQGTGASDSTLTVTDLLSGEKVAELAFNKWGISHFARAVVDVCHFFETDGSLPMMIWEATGPGRTFGKVVVEDMKYPKFYMHKDDGRQFGRASERYGWYSGGEGKRDLFQTYKELLSTRRFINPSSESIREAGFYVYESGRIEYRGPASNHDPSNKGANHGDRVIADALTAKLVFEFKGGKERNQDALSEPPPMSKAWRDANWTTKPDEDSYVTVDKDW